MTTQKFCCDVCGLTKTLPESPTHGKSKIQTGCPRCDKIQPFYAVGSAAWAVRAWGRQQFRKRKSSTAVADGGKRGQKR